MAHKKIRGLPLAHKKKVVKHLKKDIKDFKHEAKEDRELIRDLDKNKKSHSKDPKKKHVRKYSRKAEDKIKKVMHEFGKDELHSGSKQGPKVKSRKQAVAIGISEARRRGLKVPKRKKK